MLGKILSFVVAGIGLAGLFFSSEKIWPTIPIWNSIPRTFLLMGSIGIIGVGLVIMIATSKGGSGSSSKEKSIKEVPIYKDDKIIGYRRHY